MYNSKQIIRKATKELHKILLKSCSNGEGLTSENLDKMALYVKKYGTSLTKSLLIILYHNCEMSREYFKKTKWLLDCCKTKTTRVFGGLIEFTKDDIEQIIA